MPALRRGDAAGETIPPVDPAGEYRALAKEIDAAVRAVLKSGQFIGGSEVAAFEAEFGAFLGVEHVVGVGNGTDALEIALTACGIGVGDRVAVPTFTFAATVEAIVRAGAAPLLIDVVDSNLTIDVQALAAQLRAGEPIKAVIPVHLYGHPADLEALLALCAEHEILVIEDAAQAHGARCQIGGSRRRVGGLGIAGCFSFYPTKNLGAAGDGGAIVTNDATIAQTVRWIANHGDAGKYEHTLANGRNSRLDAIQAAILRIKLGHLDDWNTSRRRIAATYTSRLGDMPDSNARLPSERAGAESVFHQYAIRVAERDRIHQKLRQHNIVAGVHYPRAIHQQPGFQKFVRDGAEYPIAEQAAREVLCLPIYPLMKDAAVDRVVEALIATES